VYPLWARQAWKPTYFIFELADLLLLYRSREDYLYNPKGQVNIHHAIL
jgi:hypothetical protein